MSEYRKPLPDVQAVDFAPYWRGCREGKLMVLGCRSCGTRRWPPRPMCPECNSLEFDWVEVRGRGRIFSWTTVGRAMLPGFENDVPYAVVIVELEESPGIRFIGNVLDARPEDLRIDMPMEVVFETVAEGITMPFWRPA